jgi:Flp pilus assembly pilin Flp
LRGQGFVEYGLVVAVIALVVMIGANNLGGAEKAYFGAIGPSLAPAAPTYTPIGAPTVLTVSPSAGTYLGTVNLSATLTSNGSPVSGKTITFMLNGTPVCGGTTGVNCPTTNGSGVATLSGINLPGTIDAGTYPTGILAQFQGDSTYQIATGTGVLTVTQRSQTIAFGAVPASAPFNQPFTVTATATSGLQTTITPSGVCTAASSGTSYTVTMTDGSGTCTLTATQSGNTDYSAAPSVSVTVTATKAVGTIQLDGTSLSQTYNGLPRQVTATTTPAGRPYTVTYNGSLTAPTNVGSYAVVATLNDPDYQATTSGTLVVTQAISSVSVDAKTVSASNGTLVTLTASVYASGTLPIPAVNEGTLTFSVSGVCSAQSAPVTNGAASVVCDTGNKVTPNGTYTITVSYSDALGNFAASSGTATLTGVNGKAPLPTNLTVSPADGSVSGGSVTLHASLSDLSNNLIASKSVTLTIGGTAKCGGTTCSATATTNTNGVVTVSVKLDPTSSSNSYTISASWAGDTSYAGANGSSELTVN